MSARIKRLAALGAGGLVLLATLGVGSVAAATAPAANAALQRAGACVPLRISARANPTVGNLQAYGACEIDRRLATISVLQAAVDASPVLTDAHEAALDAILASTRDGLSALGAEIAAETDTGELRAQIKRIFEDFRVYVLVARQVWQVGAADTVDATVVAFHDTAEELEAAIDAAEAAGKDVTEAREHLAAMLEHLGTASNAVAGVADAVLALTPTDWNEGDAEPVLREARGDLVDARQALRQAARSARAVLAALQ